MSHGLSLSKEKFELQPHLVGTLVELCPLRADDFDVVFAAASDPLIWEQHPEPTRYQRATFQKYFDGAMASGGAFCVKDTKSGEVIGCTRFHGLDLTKSTVVIGYTFLIRKVWGTGHNREMKKLMVNHAFQSVKAILFNIGPENWRSRRAVEKIGAVLIEHDEKHLQRPDGSWIGTVIYRLDKPIEN